MITLLAANVVELFMELLWPMIRISALLLVAPVLSISAVTLRIRVIFAFSLTWFIYPLVDWPQLDPTTAQGLAEVFNQAALGILMGLMLQVVVGALVIAGQTIANSMGLSMATMMDPNIGSVPVLSQFFVIIGSLIFLGLSGHILLLELLLESFRMIPIGTSLLSLNAMGHLIAWSSMMFAGGVMLALPMMVILLAVNIGLGVVTRAAPTLNIFAVGFPATIIAGLLILYVSMGATAARIQWLWMAGFSNLRMILGIE